MPTVEVAYNPNDFYYTTSGSLPTPAECSNFLSNKDTWNTTCCADINDKSKCETWNDASSNCYKYELCKNKENADLANKLENNNAGALERHDNYAKQYRNGALKAVNISVSIALITYISVYFFKV
jgi:hypothetical protein